MRELLHRIGRSSFGPTNLFRSLHEVGLRAPLEFQRLRRTPAYQHAFDEQEPLVSICVATFNRARLVTERAIPSLLAQTYQNIEIIVVGDHCTDDTAERIARISDPRLRFENLAVPSRYPDDPARRWCVAGTIAGNRSIELASGTFITHLDDDDEHAPERVEKLVSFIQDTRADVVYHPFEFEDIDGNWHVNPADSFSYARVTTSSQLYHAALGAIKWDLNAAEYPEPGDWNRLRKIGFMGARTRRFPESLLKHYKERNQNKAAELSKSVSL